MSVRPVSRHPVSLPCLVLRAAVATLVLGAASAALAQGSPNDNLGQFTNLGNQVREIQSSLEAFNISQSFLLLARPVIAMLIAVNLLRAHFDAKAASKAILNGFIAMSLVSSAVDEGVFKNAVLGSWQSVYKSGTEVGMKEVSVQAKRAVTGLTVFMLGSGNIAGGAIKVIVTKGLEQMVAKTLTFGLLGGSAAVDASSNVNPALQQFKDDLNKFQEKANDLVEKTGLAVAAIAPFVGAYSVSMITLFVMAWVLAVGSTFGLIMIAAGNARGLIALAYAWIGILIATAITPLMFGQAIMIGFVNPVDRLTAGLSAKFEALFAGGNAGDILTNAFSALTSSFTYVTIALFLVVSCTVAAVGFLNSIAGRIMSVLR